MPTYTATIHVITDNIAATAALVGPVDNGPGDLNPLVGWVSPPTEIRV